MELISFDSFLTKLCDDFDELISPRKMSRSNTNIVYLLFKAIAKGWEIINSICVVLSNKFDPAKCSTEDLDSVAYLVGTERRKGSATGLKITVRNTAETSLTLLQGLYYYNLDDDTKFEFEVTSNKTVASGATAVYIAMSENIGQFPVTAQTKIDIESIQTIPDGLEFDCDNNEALLGIEPESTLAFRKRILTEYDRQNTYIELEERLRQLPYIFDCKVRFNQSEENIVVDGLTIPPMTGAIWFSGEAKNDIAEVVAEYIMCPTITSQNSIELHYVSDVFAGGYFMVNIIPFAKLNFTVDVYCTVDEEYQSKLSVQANVKSRLISAFTMETHKDFIKEEDIYSVLASFNISGFNVLAVNLKVDGSAVNYISVPPSRIPQLTDVTFPNM